MTNFSDKQKEEIIEFLLEKNDLIRHLIKKAEEEMKEETPSSDDVPVTIFTTILSPLESLTKFLKENRGKKLVEISRILKRSSAALSVAYKNSASKKLEIKETKYFIPLDEFEKNSDLSILEIVVNHLENQNLGHTEIAKILGRDVRTIWTLQKRASLKIKSRNGGEK